MSSLAAERQVASANVASAPANSQASNSAAGRIRSTSRALRMASRRQQMEGVRSGPAGPDVVAEAAGALRPTAATGHQVLEQRLDVGELGARRRIVREVGAEEKG